MADARTHLRELSVAVGIRNVNERNIENIAPQDFVYLARATIRNDISQAMNILSLDENEFRLILFNGIKLGHAICRYCPVNPSSDIFWTGADTQKEDPIDIIVGDIGFSLKEDSYILENMGLYRYLNLMTSLEYPRGLNIFTEFARDEYEEWFNYSWLSLIEDISISSWSEDYRRYVSEIRKSGTSILFLIDGEVYSRIPMRQITLDEYYRYSTFKVREKVFAKWVNAKLSSDSTYLHLKRICSEKAGENICSVVNAQFNPLNIARFLQIHEKEYYYAKSSDDRISIFLVPGLVCFSKQIEIKRTTYSVPSSQLNLHTIIRNIETNSHLELRNECRFSHGQFNGTPEAKMYYERGNDLSVIYEKIL